MTHQAESKAKVTLFEHPDDGQAPFRLHRLIEWAGLKWDTDVAHVRAASLPTPLPSPVVLALGQRSQEAALDLKRSILDTRGYVYPFNGSGHFCVPTFNPGYIQRGNQNHSATFINDLLKAMKVAREGMPSQVVDYILDPSPLRAYEWAKEYRTILRAQPRLRLAFDIETPGKGDDEEEAETGSDAPDRTWNIERIGFSFKGLSGISFPWEPSYVAAVRLLLESPGEKVVWNAGFDCPRLIRAGIRFGGTIHDGMVAWHILHTDLPKSLKFVATFVCPWQPAWKHLSSASPAYYNVTDADVELRAMEAIETELRRTNLWEVYQRDVVDLDPILKHMQEKGMPVDAEVRADRAVKLDHKLREVKAEMENIVPLEARRIEQVYVKTPKDTTGLLSRPAIRLVKRCPQCGAERPRKDHFKLFKKKSNPCAGQIPTDSAVETREYYRLAPFTPSGLGLTLYHNVLKRPLPSKYDAKSRTRKVSFNEENIMKLRLQYPDDKLYDLVLQYRSIDKIAGTYIGRPSDS